MPNPTIDSGAFSRRGTSEITLDQFNQQLRASPLWATWMAQNGIRTDRPIKLSKDQRRNFETFLQSHGIAVPKEFHIDEAGNLNQKSRAKKYALIAAVGTAAAFGVPAIIGAVGAGGGAAGGAAAAAGGSGAAAAVPAAALTSGAGGIGLSTAGLTSLGVGAGAGGSTAIGALGAASAASTPSLWRQWVRPAIEVGVPAAATVIGAKIGANAARDAAEMEAQAAREALEWQKQVYGQRQRQLAPAIGVGNAATVRLGELMGIPTPSAGYSSDTTIGPGGVPTTPAPAAAAAPTTPTAPRLVPMRAPNQQVKMVPADQVAHYQQLGAVVVE